MLTQNTVKDLERETDKRMEKCIEVTQRDFKSIRTGRASSTLVENLMVDYYGTPTALKGVANIATPDPKTIAISPWDITIVPQIEKALQQSDLGANPVSDGKCIRIQIPPLTEERRHELTKVVRKVAEDGKISIRSSRHEAIEAIKHLEKNKQISEDESRSSQKRVQKLTDDHSRKIDDLAKAKESELGSI